MASSGGGDGTELDAKELERQERRRKEQERRERRRRKILEGSQSRLGKITGEQPDEQRRASPSPTCSGTGAGTCVTSGRDPAHSMRKDIRGGGAEDAREDAAARSSSHIPVPFATGPPSSLGEETGEGDAMAQLLMREMAKLSSSDPDGNPMREMQEMLAAIHGRDHGAGGDGGRARNEAAARIRDGAGPSLPAVGTAASDEQKEQEEKDVPRGPLVTFLSSSTFYHIRLVTVFVFVAVFSFAFGTCADGFGEDPARGAIVNAICPIAGTRLQSVVAVIVLGELALMALEVYALVMRLRSQGSSKMFQMLELASAGMRLWTALRRFGAILMLFLVTLVLVDALVHSAPVPL